MSSPEHEKSKSLSPRQPTQTSPHNVDLISKQQCSSSLVSISIPFESIGTQLEPISPLRSRSRETRSPSRSSTRSRSRRNCSRSRSPTRSRSRINCSHSRSPTRSRSRINCSRSRSPTRSRSRSQSSRSSRSDNNTMMKNIQKDIKLLKTRMDKQEKTLEKIHSTMASTNVMLQQLLQNSSTCVNDSLTPNSNPSSAPDGYDEPEFPMRSLDSLRKLERSLKDPEIFAFHQENLKPYCVPSSGSSVSKVLTSMLKSIMSLDLRQQTSLTTVTGRYPLREKSPRFLKLLNDSMIAGYKLANKSLNPNEQSDAVVLVWSRTTSDIKRHKAAQEKRLNEN